MTHFPSLSLFYMSGLPDGPSMFSDHQEEVATEDTEVQAEDWKDSDLHLSCSSDDSSPWGTPLTSSPCMSTASLPL